MQTGTVKWFNNAKGYGFITPSDGSEDVFVHFSTIEGDGYKSLNEGQQVEFEHTQGPKGKQTTRVIPPLKKIRTDTRFFCFPAPSMHGAFYCIHY